MRRTRIVALLSVIFLVSLSAQGQRFLGTITGTVTDPSGAVVPDTEVKVTDVGTGLARTVRSDTQGVFTFPQLPLGTYQVSATKAGFKQYVKTDVVLHVADILSVPIRLQTGQVSEQITVEANQVQVQTESGELSGLITGQQVRELPLNGRNFVQLSQLMPGVSTAETFDTKNKGLLTGVDMSVSGSGATNNLWLVDGASNNDVGSNRTILVYPSVDTIAEFKVQRNSYGPEFGQAAGAQINIVTRQGSNAFHGDVYYFGRNDVFNARNYFLARTGEKDKIRRHDYGYTIGGPIVKDRVFFFWSQEWNREKRGTTRTSFVPTAAEKAGDFSATHANFVATNGLCGADTPVDPVTGNPFPGNIIPANELSPAGLLYAQLYPDPNTPINPSTCVNWIASVNTPINWREESIRTDINITKSSTLMIRYTQDTWKNDAPNAGEANGLWGDDPFPGVDSAWDQPGKQFVAKLTQTIGDTAVNSLQFSYAGNRINVTRGGPDAGLNDQINQAAPPIFGFDSKTTGDQVAHPTFWGAQGYQPLWNMAPWSNLQDLYALRDDFTKVMGQHSLKAGVLFGWNKKNEFIGGASSAEQSEFSGAFDATTGNTIADFLLKGLPLSFDENRTQPDAHTRWKDLEFYAGDTWKIKRNLTLDLGLRYSIMYEPYDAANAIGTFDPTLFNPALGDDPCNGLLFPKDNPCTAAGFLGGAVTSNRAIRNTDYNTIAPRLGIAWDMYGNGKTVLRAGGGQFFQRERVSPYLPVAGNPPFSANINGSRTLDNNPADTLAACLDCSTSNGSPNAGIDLRSTVPNTWQWNVTVEQELAKNTVLELSYVGSRGIHLTSTWDANEVAPANRLAYVHADAAGDNDLQAALRPFPELASNGNILMFGRTGNSIYHSLQTQVRGRFGRGSQFEASYTWSKLIDDGLLDSSDGGLSAGSIIDTSNPGLTRGPSALNRPHIFNASVVYLTPALSKANGALRGVFGNWEVATIVILSNGASITPHTGAVEGLNTGPSGTGYLNNQLLMRTPGVPCRNSGGPPEQWLNPNAFTLTGFELGTIGTAHRGECYGPGLAQTDLAIYKNFAVPFIKSRWTSEKMTIQFRAEMFNVFNNAQFRNLILDYNGINTVFDTGDPATATKITSSTPGAGFGSAQLARDPRQIQFGLKLSF
jgi:hypothetical protein